MNTALLEEIERFLAKSGFSPSHFGWLACRNRRVVQRLRDGKDIATRTETRIRAWLAENEERKPNQGWRRKP